MAVLFQILPCLQIVLKMLPKLQIPISCLLRIVRRLLTCTRRCLIHEDAVSKWCCDADTTFRSCVEDQHRYDLLMRKIAREKPKIHTGNLASSTVVGAAGEFVSWLKTRDRKYLAIEMEAAGVLCATYGMSTETVIIRGISDLADDRKQGMDRIGGGGLRRYAMENAISILLTYMRLGLFPHRTLGTTQLTIPIADA